METLLQTLFMLMNLFSELDGGISAAVAAADTEAMLALLRTAVSFSLKAPPRFE